MRIRQLYMHTAATAVAARVISGGAGLVTLWFVARTVEKDVFGLIMLALTVVSFMASSVVAALGRLLLYRVTHLREGSEGSEHQVLAGTALLAGGAVALALAAAVVLLAPAISARMHKPDLEKWLYFMALLLPLQTLRGVLSAWFRARQKVPQSLLHEQIVPDVLKVALVALVWGLALGGEGVAAAYVLPALAAVLLWPELGTLRLRSIRSVFGAWDLSYALKNLATRVVNQRMQSLDIILVGVTATTLAASEYIVASRLSQLVLLGKNIFFVLLVPRLGITSAREDFRQREREYDTVRNLSFMIALSVAIVFVIFGPSLLSLFGDFRSANPVLQLLVAAMLVEVGFGPTGGYLAIAGYAGRVFSTAALGLAVILLGAFLFAGQGGYSVAMALVACAWVVNGLRAVMIWRLERHTVADGFLLGAMAVLSLDLVLAAFGVVTTLAALVPLLGVLQFLAWRERHVLGSLLWARNPTS